MLFWISFLCRCLRGDLLCAAGRGAACRPDAVCRDRARGLQPFGAMESIGFSPLARSVIFRNHGGLQYLPRRDWRFCHDVFRPRRRNWNSVKQRPLAEGAAACAAVLCWRDRLAVLSLAGGEGGALLGATVRGMGGLLLTVMSVNGPRRRDGGATDERRHGRLTMLIADHAASHAAFSAQLASMTRRGAIT